MNWQQLFTATPPHEHTELLIKMLRRLERRRRLQKIFRAISPVIPDRRMSTRQYHFVGGDRRRQISLHRLYLHTISTIFLGFLIGLLLMIFQIHPTVSGVILFGYDAIMIYIVFAKLYLRWRSA